MLSKDKIEYLEISTLTLDTFMFMLIDHLVWMFQTMFKVQMVV